jgi:hypothetical protein
MSIIREQIKYLGVPVNLKFDLSSSDNFLGYQQEIDNLTQNTGDDLINPAVDLEERRFKYASALFPTVLKFNFTQNGTTYGNSFINAGFTQLEINSISPNVQNSFFIFEYYDTYDINTQTKILTTYNTKVVTATNKIPSYTFNSTNQVYCLYVPLDYITKNVDLGITGITGYTKISFYNAKSGRIALFNNLAYTGLSTSLSMFFPTYLNFTNRTWKLILPSTNYTVTAKQLWLSQAYINKVNDTFTNFTDEAQDYPTGSVFNYVNGKYINPI